MKFHHKIMLTIIYLLCVPSRNFYQLLTNDHTPTYVLKHNGNGGVVFEVKRPIENFLFPGEKCQYLTQVVLSYDFSDKWH